MHRIPLKSLVRLSLAASLLIAVVFFSFPAGEGATPCTGSACSQAEFGHYRASIGVAALEEALGKAWLAVSVGQGAAVSHSVGDAVLERGAQEQAPFPETARSFENGIWPPTYHWDIASQLGTAVPGTGKGEPFATLANRSDLGGVSPQSDWAGRATDLTSNVARFTATALPTAPASRGAMMLVAVLGIIGLMVRRRFSSGLAGVLH